MATLNTAIRGAQISLSEEVFAVADKLAFIDADGVMKYDAWADIATAVAGDGLQNTANQFAIDVSDFAGEGLEDDASENLRVKLDGTTLARSASGVKVKDAGITETQLNTSVAGVGLSGGGGSALAVDLNELVEDVVDVGEDYFAFIDKDTGADDSNKESIADLVTAMAGTGLTATSGVLSVDTIADNLVEGDIQMENVSSQIADTGYAGDFTISNTPIANSVQVFLNGLLQEEGTGKDYTISGTTVSFVTDPVSGDIVIVYYIIDN